MEDFLDRIEDFLERGSTANAMTYSFKSGIWVFGYDGEYLALIHNEDEPDMGIFNGEISEIPDDFIEHVLDALQPTEIEIEKC